MSIAQNAVATNGAAWITLPSVNCAAPQPEQHEKTWDCNPQPRPARRSDSGTGLLGSLTIKYSGELQKGELLWKQHK